MKNNIQKDFTASSKIFIAFNFIAVAICSMYVSYKIALSDFEIGEIMSVIIAVGFIMFAIIVQTIIHETGHLIFGLITGYKFYSFRIFLFMIYRDTEKGSLKFRFFGLLGTSGQCLMEPPEREDNDFPYILYNYGGVIFNLVSVIIFALLFLLFSNIMILNLTLYCFAIMGFALAIINGVPMDTGYIGNDAKNTIALYQNPRAKEVFKLMMKIHIQVMEGTKISELPNEWLEVEEGDNLSPISAYIPLINSERAAINRDFETAKSLAEKVAFFPSKAIPYHKMLAYMMLIYCEAVGEARSTIISAYETKPVIKFMRSARLMPNVLRAKYAVEVLVNRDIDAAMKIKFSFERAAAKANKTDDVETERAFFEYVDEKAASI